MRRRWIFAFEGPCLSGKTVTLEAVRTELVARNVPVLRVDDYTRYAGGHENFPPVVTRSASDARSVAEYFLDLEAKRRNDVAKWLRAQSTETVSVVLVDRLICTCMRVRERVGDSIGYRIFEEAARKGTVILPDVTFLLELPPSKEEVARRSLERTAFEGSEILYDPGGYAECLMKIERTIPLNLYRVGPDQLADVPAYVFRALLG